MSVNIEFHQNILDTIAGGLSAIDLPRLEIKNLEEAYQFASAYGYDLTQTKDIEKIWSFHRRAVTFIRESLLNPDESIPDELADPAQLGDVARLLVLASTSPQQQDEKSQNLQRWACALLRVIHVYSHIENDLFIEFSDPIQEQVLKPFREHIATDPALGPILGRSEHIDQIPLKRFDIKPFKATSSSVIKLLIKPQATAFTLLDRMGIRFVTRTTYDAFRVVRFLEEEHLISFPNIMPDQSRNTLYPTNLFCEVLDELQPTATEDEIEMALQKKMAASVDRASFLEKKNEFSSISYRAVKFIARQLIQLQLGEKTVRFFFPYEVQIMDQDTYVKNLSGATAHDEYKDRQRAAARARVLLQAGRI